MNSESDFDEVSFFKSSRSSTILLSIYTNTLTFISVNSQKKTLDFVTLFLFYSITLLVISWEIV